MISRNTYPLFWLLALSTLCQCQRQASGADADTLFQLMDASATGVDFQNTITPDEVFNLLDFEYLYNGGGVGVADFDNNGLPDLVFTGNMVASKIYLNQGKLQFKDITEAAGFTTAGKWCTGVAIVDINRDGYDDIYLSVGGPGKQSIYPNLLFLNQGDLTFREAAADYGLADPNESNQAVFFDYDQDGDLDMYLLNGGGFEKSAVTIRPIITDGSSRNTDKLYQNNFDETLGHPVFMDVSKEAGIRFEGFGLGVGIIDVNDDQWPDIYVSNDYLSRDYLYVNQQDGTFSEEAMAYFDHLSHFSMGNDIGDINNDGLPDIMTLDMLPESHQRRKLMFGPNQYDKFYQAVDYGYGYQYMRNMLQVGQQDHRFSEIGQLAGLDRTDWSWCPLMADFDNDGWQDLYITNGYGKDITDLDFVKFRKDAVSRYTSQEEVRKKMIASLDDLPSITLPNYLYRNQGNSRFENKGTAWGISQSSISNGAAYADLDQDGDLELITNNIDQKVFIYKNTLVETDSSKARFLAVKLNGSSNSKGVGARVSVRVGTEKQLRYQQPVRGFQSSVTEVLHFGVGEHTTIDEVEVTWPSGKSTLLKAVAANQCIVINEADAETKENQPVVDAASLLAKIDKINYIHQEPAPGNYFQVQPLLLHGFTHQGPGLAVGDVNNDGHDDLFIGGPYGQPAHLYLQTAQATFVTQVFPTENYEDLGALFFDVDEDGDLDLYVVSGGSERYQGHQYYQDRIYLNDGKGNFTLNEAALPEMLTSTATVVGGDYDQDGDVDLFVGGRVVPGSYPLSPPSYLLENRAGKFMDVTEQVCPALTSVGMVTAAVWTDFNNDHQQDLIVVGEMMNISLFENQAGRLKNISAQAGLAHATGLWNSIAPGDFDNDGDTDYVLGNIGSNLPFTISSEHPLSLHFADFDQNGTIDPIYSSFEEGDYHPLPSLDLLTAQLPLLKKKFLHYRDYAASTTESILALLGTSSMETLYCENGVSILLENQGGKHFVMHSLPLMAQVAPTKGIVTEDFNQDGRLDIMLVGNDYNTEVVNGNYDASRGTVLLNTGQLKFTTLTAKASGVNTHGDTRSAVKLALSNDQQLLILVSKNSGALENYLLESKSDQPWYNFRPGEVSATISTSNGATIKLECPIGSGYLSQQTRKFWLPPNTNKVSFWNSQGGLTREMEVNLPKENI
ncbi:VCBS repeat-containing protein [Lewinella sp. LCG006]|uniref:VCBS repeat-containing protein n=1 Tax=Lewinella sp. LCG006 TaxID=3231911 RepID=UPI00345FC38B